MDIGWTALASISGALSAATVLFALVYARGQVREASLARQAAIIQSFQQSYHERERRIFRLRLLKDGDFGLPEDFDGDSLAREDALQFFTLIDQLEFLGVMVDRGLLDFELVVAAFRSTPPRVWLFIRPWVLRKRAADPPPVHSLFLEKLAKKYDDYYQETYGMPHQARRGISAVLMSSHRSPEELAMKAREDERDSPTA
jgi:hypothetical protein